MGNRSSARWRSIPEGGPTVEEQLVELDWEIEQWKSRAHAMYRVAEREGWLQPFWYDDEQILIDEGYDEYDNNPGAPITREQHLLQIELDKTERALYAFLGNFRSDDKHKKLVEIVEDLPLPKIIIWDDKQETVLEATWQTDDLIITLVKSRPVQSENLLPVITSWIPEGEKSPMA